MAQARRDRDEAKADAVASQSGERDDPSPPDQSAQPSSSRQRSMLTAILAAIVGFAFAWVTFDLVAALFQ